MFNIYNIYSVVSKKSKSLFLLKLYLRINKLINLMGPTSGYTIDVSGM